MRGKWKVAAACGISVVLVAAMAPAAAAAGGKGSTLEVLLDEGSVVTQGSRGHPGSGSGHRPGRDSGAPGPALVYDLRGKGAGSIYPVTDPTMPLNLIDVAVSPKDGTGWGIQAGENGRHPDPSARRRHHRRRAGHPGIPGKRPGPGRPGQSAFPTESNAYGLTVDRKGNALVADAANNDLTPGDTGRQGRRRWHASMSKCRDRHGPPDIPGCPIPTAGNPRRSRSDDGHDRPGRRTSTSAN